MHWLTLGDILQEHRRSWPAATAVVDGPVRLTYPALDERVNRLSNALLAQGVTAGDRILWWGQNSFRLLELVFAASRTGAVLCPANWRQSADELRFVLDDLEPALVVWQKEDLGDTVAAVRGDRGATALWLQHDADGPGSYEDFLRGGDASDPGIDADPTQPVLAMYTGAFGGAPRAALLSDQAVIGHNMALALARQMEPGFRYLDSGPLFHVGTLSFCLATAHLAGTNVMMARFDAREACRLIEAERCQAMFVLPNMMQEMVEANAAGTFDLTSLQASAGSPEWNRMVSPDTTPWGRALGGYGQTEVGGMLTYLGYGLGGIGTHGRPSPLMQVRIVDPDGHDVEDGGVGEIVTRGWHTARGYLNRVDDTRRRQSGGWDHTGDLGRRESDGTLSFIGPKLRLIKSGAENVYPAEVERCILTHDAVAECAVIGVPDSTWGQSVKAIVVAVPGASLTSAEVIEHCRTRIASYKKPRLVEFVDAIPRQGFAADYDRLDERHGGGGYPGT